MKDQEHIEVLVREMGTDDLQIAREAVDLIGRRGFQEDPERNLLVELAKLLDQASSNQDF